MPTMPEPSSLSLLAQRCLFNSQTPVSTLQAKLPFTVVQSYLDNFDAGAFSTGFDSRVRTRPQAMEYGFAYCHAYRARRCARQGDEHMMLYNLRQSSFRVARALSFSPSFPDDQPSLYKITVLEREAVVELRQFQLETAPCCSSSDEQCNTCLGDTDLYAAPGCPTCSCQ